MGSIGGAATEEVHVTLGELVPGTTYYYRVTATNADGTAQGTDRTFTTPAYNNPIVQPFTLPLIASPAIAFPAETTNTATTPKGLTNAQKLAKALKACRKKPKGKRASCEKQVRKKFKKKK